MFISKSIATVHKSSSESIHNVVCVSGFFTNVGIILNFHHLMLTFVAQIFSVEVNRASKVR